MKKALLFLGIAFTAVTTQAQEAKKEQAVTVQLTERQINILNDIINKTNAPFIEVNELVSALQQQIASQVKPATDTAVAIPSIKNSKK